MGDWVGVPGPALGPWLRIRGPAGRLEHIRSRGMADGRTTVMKCKSCGAEETTETIGGLAHSVWRLDFIKIHQYCQGRRPRR